MKEEVRERGRRRRKEKEKEKRRERKRERKKKEARRDERDGIEKKKKIKNIFLLCHECPRSGQKTLRKISDLFAISSFTSNVKLFSNS